MEIKGYLTNEEWGTNGAASSAARIYWNTEKRNMIKQETHYAQFWITPDPNTQCKIVDDGLILGYFLEKHPEVLGKANYVYKGKLPFIIKVMSVKRLLSLQFHPKKLDAEKLHKQEPRIYRDNNHKPKLIMSLNKFEILYGFRPSEEIKSFLKAIPELSIIIPFEKQNDFISKGLTFQLRDIILHWLTASPAQMKLSLDMFFERMIEEDIEVQLDHCFGIIKRFHEQHPYDPGVFSPFFMNHIFLFRNDAVFIQCGFPYTFLSGDCLQVSGISKNRILLAFTGEKYSHIHEAVEMITMNSVSPEDVIFNPKRINENIVSYLPPAREFAVNRVEARADTVCLLPVHDSCSIFIVTKGEAECFIKPSFYGKKTLKMGSVIFVFPYQKLSITVIESIILYQIFPNTEYYP